jgi:hypothetical protein
MDVMAVICHRYRRKATRAAKWNWLLVLEPLHVSRLIVA